MVPHKPWYASKTIWVNLIIVVLAALVQIQAIPGVPPEVAPWIVVLIGTLNAALRVITSTAITGSAASLPAGALQPDAPVVGKPLINTQTAGAGGAFLTTLSDATRGKIADEDVPTPLPPPPALE